MLATTGGAAQWLPGDWQCSAGDCQAHNFASRTTCFKCNTPKPGNDGGGTSGGKGGKAKGKNKDNKGKGLGKGAPGKGPDV